jgi:hypothetical protein
MENLLWITDAKYAGGYKIALTFNDGLRKTVDLENHLSGEIFEPLKEKDCFTKFFVSHWTVEWENGADMAPEFLYAL